MLDLMSDLMWDLLLDLVSCHMHPLNPPAQPQAPQPPQSPQPQPHPQRASMCNSYTPRYLLLLLLVVVVVAVVVVVVVVVEFYALCSKNILQRVQFQYFIKLFPPI